MKSSDVEKPLSAKDLKVRISEVTKEIDRLQSVVGELESLPVIHQDLQDKVRGLARILAYLEGMIERMREKPSIEKMVEIIQGDLKELQEKRSKGTAPPLV